MFLPQSKQTNKQTNLKGRKKTFRGDGNVYYLDCGDGNMSVYICPDSPNFIYYVQFSCIPIITQ